MNPYRHRANGVRQLPRSGAGFGPPNDLPVQRGGVDGRRPGVRAVPSLMYSQNIPPFTEHYFDDEGDDSIDQGPAGGRTWDGRSQSAHDQARLPLFSPFEMANATAESVVAKVQHARLCRAISRDLRRQGVRGSCSGIQGCSAGAETFQQTAAEFYPYSSKYDAFLRHEAR